VLISIGLRAVQRPGDSYSWQDALHGLIRTSETNEDGVAEINYPKWVSRETAMLTSAVSVAVEHPDYCVIQHFDCQIPRAGIVTAIPRIRLHKGGRLRIKAFREASNEPLAHFRPIVSRQWYPSGWRTDGDAQLSPVFASGEHVLRIVDDSDPEAMQFSDPAVFNLEPGTTKDLEVRLHLGIPVRGELLAPKPIKRGYVLAHIVDFAAGAASNYDQSISWRTWTTVAENGEFEFRSLPQTSSVALLAWCDGFVCQMPDSSTVPLHMTSVEPQRLPQFFSLKPDQNFCRVTMEETAKCEITVTGPDGRPIEGVSVGFSPNVSYQRQTSWWFGESPRNENERSNPEATFSEFLLAPIAAGSRTKEDDPDHLWPTYDLLTDADGKAFIQNLPGRGMSTLDVTHEKYVPRGEVKPPFHSNLSVDLKPGKISRIAVNLKVKPKLTKAMLSPPPPPTTKNSTFVQQVRELFEPLIGP
jgi:hypothetical protein